MRFARYTFAALVLSLAACSQKDPGSPSESDDYFPLNDGARYEYKHSSSGWIELVEIEAGEDGTFLQHQSGDPDGESSTSTFEVVDGDVLRVAEDQLIGGELVYSVEYDPGFLRFSAAWVSAEIGFEETRRYERTETQFSAPPGSGGSGGGSGGGGSGGSSGGGSGDAGPETKDPQPRAHTFTVESITQTVKVPAGTFKNCLRVRRIRALDDPSIDDPMAQEEQDKLYWFAPGVGKIQEENVMTGTTEQLESYDFGEE
jgi:hypothetical protein